MKHEEIARLMGSVAPTIAEFVVKAMAPLRAENERLSSSLAAVERRFTEMSAEREQDRVVFINLVREEISKVDLPVKEIDPAEVERIVVEKVETAVAALPVPLNGKDADPVDLDEVASRAAKLLPVPQDGRDVDPEVIRQMVAEQVALIPVPENGKDVDPETVAAMVAEEVTKAVAAIPVPENGKGADPVVLAEMVAVEVAKIPPAEPGKSVDPADVEAMLELMVQKAVAALPPAPAGKDADPAVIAAMVADEVAKLPPAVDGKDADPTLVAGLVASEVTKALEAWPRPVDGKSVTVDDVRPVLEEMVAAIPVPTNGKDADPAEIAALIVEDVAKLIPVPADGKSVSLDEVLQSIEEMVEKRLSAIPPPKDGADGVDGADVVEMLIDRDGVLIATLSNGKTKALGPVVGRDADIPDVEQIISEKVAEIPVPVIDEALVARFVDEQLARISKNMKPPEEFAPDDVAISVALAVKMMAEAPQTKQQTELQPINVYSDVRMPEMKFPETIINVTTPEQAAPVVNMAAPIVNVAPASVEMPKRGKEVTTVTSYDKDGRIKTFEKQEVDE